MIRRQSSYISYMKSIGKFHQFDFCAKLKGKGYKIEEKSSLQNKSSIHYNNYLGASSFDYS